MTYPLLDTTIITKILEKIDKTVKTFKIQDFQIKIRKFHNSITVPNET